MTDVASDFVTGAVGTVFTTQQIEAVLETCRERVRPVMLTAVTAILGVLPIAFGVNLALLSHEVTFGAPSTQWWIALSSAIVFGLAFSTIFICLADLAPSPRPW